MCECIKQMNEWIKEWEIEQMDQWMDETKVLQIFKMEHKERVYFGAMETLQMKEKTSWVPEKK